MFNRLKKEDKYILCPDCQTVQILKKDYDNGKLCKSCATRKFSLERWGKQYIPFKDLTKEEQNQILDTRYKVNNYNKKNTIKNSKDHVTKELKDLVKLYYIDQGYSLNKTLMKIKETNTIYNDLTYYKLKLYVDKTFKAEEKPKNNVNRSKVFTDEIKSILSVLRTKDMYLSDIYDVLKAKTNSDNLTKDNLRKYLAFHKIEYRKCTPQEKMQKIREAKSLNKQEKTYECKPMTVKELFGLDKEERKENLENEETKTLSNILNESLNKCEKIEEQLTNNILQEERFKSVEEEVKSVAEFKFKELNSYLDHSYTTEEYLKFLEMLLYLSTHSNEIIEKRKNQEDILNSYQVDIVHEIEQEVSRPGDTYLQDKLHAMREFRRFIKYDREDVAIMNNLLNKIDSKQVERTLDYLREKVGFRENSIYRPEVDNTLVDKYTWAKYITPDSAKANKNILTSKFMTNKGEDKRKHLNTYRVSCKLSCDGQYYQNWSNEYQTINEDIALDYATNELKQLASRYKNLRWKCLKIKLVK